MIENLLTPIATNRFEVVFDHPDETCNDLLRHSCCKFTWGDSEVCLKFFDDVDSSILTQLSSYTPRMLHVRQFGDNGKLVRLLSCSVGPVDHLSLSSLDWLEADATSQICIVYKLKAITIFNKHRQQIYSKTF